MVTWMSATPYNSQPAAGDREFEHANNVVHMVERHHGLEKNRDRSPKAADPKRLCIPDGVSDQMVRQD